MPMVLWPAGRATAGTPDCLPNALPEGSPWCYCLVPYASQVYYADMSSDPLTGRVMRRHGDEVQRLVSGYYCALGRYARFRGTAGPGWEVRQGE